MEGKCHIGILVQGSKQNLANYEVLILDLEAVPCLSTNKFEKACRVCLKNLKKLEIHLPQNHVNVFAGNCVGKLLGGLFWHSHLCLFDIFGPKRHFRQLSIAMSEGGRLNS